MYNTKPARPAAWNRMEFATNFDKQRRAIKLGQHRERLISTHREIDNSTPRCFKQYKIMHQRHKNYKKREKLLDKKRRERLSMLSPYKKHLNIPKSNSHPHLLQFERCHTSHGKYTSYTTTTTHILDDIKGQSLSPTNSSLTNSSFGQSQSNQSQSNQSQSNQSQSISSSSMAFIRQQYKRKRRGNMKTLSTLTLHKNENIRKKQQKIEYENEILKKRLSEMKPSNYLNTIQKHWNLHNSIRKNMQKTKKKSVKCPDIIYTQKYRKLIKENSPQSGKNRKRRKRTKQSMHKSSSLPNCKPKKHTISPINISPANSNKENAKNKLPSLKY